MNKIQNDDQRTITEDWIKRFKEEAHKIESEDNFSDFDPIIRRAMVNSRLSIVEDLEQQIREYDERKRS